MKRMHLPKNLYARIGKLSIAHKLVAFVLLTSAAVILISSIVFTGQQWFKARDHLVTTLNVETDMLVENSKSAIIFNNTQDAEVILSAFRAQPSIVWAHIVLPDDHLFASYLRDQEQITNVPRALKPGIYINKGFVQVSKLIKKKDKHIGTLFVLADT